MKYIFIVLVAIVPGLCRAQAPFIQWQKCLGGTGDDYAQSIIQTADSGYVVASNASSNNDDVSGNHGGTDYWIAKMTPLGGLAWQKCFGGSSGELVQSLQQTADGGFIVAGVSISTDGDVTGNHGMNDYWVIKLSDTGGLVWEKSLGGSGQDFCHYVRQTSDGGYIVVGESNSNDGDVTGNHGGFDAWIVRLSSSGSIIWEKSLGGTGDDNGAAVVQTSDGGFLVTCNTSSNNGDVTYNHGGDDYWVVKLSDTGHIEWQKTYGGSGNDDLTDELGAGALQRTNDGGYVMAGWSNSTNGDVTGNHGGFDFWAVKIDDTGRLEWQKSLGGTGDDEAISIEQTADAGYVVAGITASNDFDVSGNHGGDAYWVAKISDTGHLQWQKCLGGTGFVPNNCANAIHQTLGGGYIVAGYTNANDFDVSGNHGGYDAWVVKLNCTMPSVGALTGPSELCAGSTITLSDTAAGGSWTTVNSHAAVSAGVVSGISGGIDSILYTLANTCGAEIAVKAVTVNPLPVPVVTLTGMTLSTASGFVSYQWSLNGTPIPGATNSTYHESASGDYTVTVTDANGCVGTSVTDTLHNVGFQEINTSAAGIHIFPNPATDYLTIAGAGNPDVKLYNTMGQMVKEEVGSMIIISELPDGVYLLTVSDQFGVLVLRQSILKQ